MMEATEDFVVAASVGFADQMDLEGPAMVRGNSAGQEAISLMSNRGLAVLLTGCFVAPQISSDLSFVAPLHPAKNRRDPQPVH